MSGEKEGTFLLLSVYDLPQLPVRKIQTNLIKSVQFYKEAITIPRAISHQSLDTTSVSSSLAAWVSQHSRGNPSTDVQSHNKWLPDRLLICNVRLTANGASVENSD